MDGREENLATGLRSSTSPSLNSSLSSCCQETLRKCEYIVLHFLTLSCPTTTNLADLWPLSMYNFRLLELTNNIPNSSSLWPEFKSHLLAGGFNRYLSKALQNVIFLFHFYHAVAQWLNLQMRYMTKSSLTGWSRRTQGQEHQGRCSRALKSRKVSGSKQKAHQFPKQSEHHQLTSCHHWHSLCGDINHVKASPEAMLLEWRPFKTNLPSHQAGERLCK